MIGADDVFCCTEPPRKDPKSAFAVVATEEELSGRIRTLLRPELVVPYEMVEGLAESLADIDLSLTC